MVGHRRDSRRHGCGNNLGCHPESALTGLSTMLLDHPVFSVGDLGECRHPEEKPSTLQSNR
jgi:hypothetical protein